MEKYYDVIIVGGGPAGLSAAIYSARSGAKTAVIEALFAGGVAAATPVIENYPGFTNISGFELAQKMQEQAAACGAEIIYGKAVEIKDGERKTVVLESGESLVCGALVLALGSEPRKLGVSGEDELLGAGLSYCATCDGNFFRGKTVTVAGVGNHAVSAAEYLLPIAKKVYVVSPGKAVNVTGAECIGNAKITALGGNPLESVTIACDSGEHVIKTDGLFVTLGYKPAVGLIKGLINTDGGGYIICDERMQTNVAGIFAAGDARSKSLRQIVTAASDGAIAGQFAALYARKAGK